MSLNKFSTYVPLIILFIGLALGLIIKKPTYKVPEGKVLVTQVFLDSLKYVANLPPVITVHDSIVHDTVWIPQTHNPKPTVDPVDSTLNQYSDSLQIKDEVDVSITFKTSGLVKGGINWLYKPIYKEKIITIDRPVPYPVNNDILIPTYKTGLYASIAVDFGGKNFLIGPDIDIVTKNDYIYGIQYRRFGEVNIYGVKFGFKLFNKR
jgi:hypothetical protein